SVRATEIETFDRASVIIPNSELITGVVKNWTHGNPSGRIICKVRASFGSDPEQVRDILLGCARDHPLVLDRPEPRAFLVACGDTAGEFGRAGGVGHVDSGGPVKRVLPFEILPRFRAASIPMPFPPHELRFPPAGEPLLPAGPKPPAGEPKPAPG